MVGSACRPLVLTVAVLVFVGIAAGCSREEEATPAEIVQAIEHQVGPSNAPASATIPWMPYELPLPAGAQPVLVGNTRVYLNAAPDTAIVVRPTVNGVQTFMYLSGPEAPDHYGFKFTLLPNTKLEKANNGSIIMVDTKNGNAVPVLKQPWAVSTEARLTYHTDFSVSHSTVTQIIDLQNARFPLIADPDFEDPLTQIIEGRVPAIAEARSTAKDGPPTYIPGGLGRFYAGPNGLEIRFTSSGTLAAIQLPYALSGAGGEAAAALLAKVLANSVQL